MAVQPLEQQTYLPEPADEVAPALNFIRAHQGRPGSASTPGYFLSGAGEQVEIPAAVHRVLLQVLEAMRAGKAVTVAPQNELLTTQQAADLLGVSRPTVVKLIEDGLLPSETPGQRRRLVKLDDVLGYRAKRREEQYRALLETSTDYDDLESAETMETRFRRVRAEVAAKRQASRDVEPLSTNRDE
ncbi:MAG: helix-turn-helix domain-containing protein [Microlunatus sp.]